MARYFAKAGKPIVAICHGAHLPTAAGGASVDAAMTEAHMDGKLVFAAARLGRLLKVPGTRIER